MTDTKAPPELRPCPFCGTDKPVLSNNQLHCWEVFCRNCGASMSVQVHQRDDEAVIAWNTRADLVSSSTGKFDLDPLEFWCDLAEVLGHPRPAKVNPASLVAEVNERLATGVNARASAIEIVEQWVYMPIPSAKHEFVDGIAAIITKHCGGSSEAEAMRRACVEKVREMGNVWLQEANSKNRMFSDKTNIATQIITALESVQLPTKEGESSAE